MMAISSRVSLAIAAPLALLLGIVLSIAAPGATPARANALGTQLHVFTDPNEKGLATRVVRLSSSPNTLIATFEHWNPVTNANVPWIIKRSIDDGATWTTISNVNDGVTGGTHPWPTKWTPSIIELQAPMAGYSAGVLLMAAAIFNPATSESQIQLFSSADQGVNWTFRTVVTTAAPGTGVWEPMLYVNNANNLVMVYADDDESPSYAQTVAQMVSTNGGTTWGTRTNIVAAANALDRPGMPAVTKLPNNTYRLVYEFCENSIGDPWGCPVYTKTSSDGVTWPAGKGTLIQSTDGRFFGSSPNIVWAPGPTPNGQLIVSGSATRLIDNPTAVFPPEHLNTLMVSYDLGTTWYRMGTPFYPNDSCDKVPDFNGIHWSATLLPAVNGSEVRMFTPNGRAGSNYCNAYTGKANVGAMPYTNNFSVSDGGWIGYGGSWAVSSSQYRETSGGVNGPKALFGSTGWTNYTVAADVTPVSAGGDAGVLWRVSASAVGADEMSGYYAGIGVGGGLFVGKMSAGTYTPLGSTAVTGGIVANTAYRINVVASGTQHTVTVTAPGGGAPKATLVVNDSSFLRGQIGVRNLGTNANFDNVSVTAHTSATTLPYSQAFGGAVADWLPYGGAWSVNGSGQYAETSGGVSGPKAVVGQSAWSNYTATADVSVGAAGGDAGVLIRVGDNPTVRSILSVIFK